MITWYLQCRQLIGSLHLKARNVSAHCPTPLPSLPPRRLYNLVQPPPVDVGVELHPQGEVVGELEAEGLAGELLAGIQLFDVVVVDEEVQGAAGLGNAVVHGGQVQDLVVASGLTQVGAIDDLVAVAQLGSLARGLGCLRPPLARAL